MRPQTLSSIHYESFYLMIDCTPSQSGDIKIRSCISPSEMSHTYDNYYKGKIVISQHSFCAKPSDILVCQRKRKIDRKDLPFSLENGSHPLHTKIIGHCEEVQIGAHLSAVTDSG